MYRSCTTSGMVNKTSSKNLSSFAINQFLYDFVCYAQWLELSDVENGSTQFCAAHHKLLN